MVLPVFAPPALQIPPNPGNLPSLQLTQTISCSSFRPTGITAYLTVNLPCYGPATPGAGSDIR